MGMSWWLRGFDLDGIGYFCFIRVRWKNLTEMDGKERCIRKFRLT